MVMFNQEEPSMNEFIEVKGQEQLMKDLDDKFKGLSEQNAAPIIFAHNIDNGHPCAILFVLFHSLHTPTYKIPFLLLVYSTCFHQGPICFLESRSKSQGQFSNLITVKSGYV